MSRNFKKALQAEMALHGVTFLMIVAMSIVTLVVILVTVLHTLEVHSMLREQKKAQTPPMTTSDDIYGNKIYGRSY